MGHYQTAQICLNGHVITEAAEYSELRAEFCRRCGTKTITACPRCRSAIRGHYHVSGFIGAGPDYELPRFCHSCGEAYPWTASKLEAAQELADELEGLNDEERALLKKGLEDLVRESPNMEVAGLRVKKVLKKVGTGGVEIVRSILVDVLSETARKALGV